MDVKLADLCGRSGREPSVSELPPRHLILFTHWMRVMALDMLKHCLEMRKRKAYRC